MARAKIGRVLTYENVKPNMSFTLKAILIKIYRKDNYIPKNYRSSFENKLDKFVEKLKSSQMVKEVNFKGNTYYFLTEEYKNLTAEQVAVEFLWKVWNRSKRKIENNKRMIYIYSDFIEEKEGYIEVQKAIKEALI